MKWSEQVNVLLNNRKQTIMSLSLLVDTTVRKGRKPVTLFMQGNFHAFVVICRLFKNQKNLKNTIRLPNGLNPDQDRCSVCADLGSKCWQRLSAALAGKELRVNGPLHEKSCIRGFRQSKFQTSTSAAETIYKNWNFTCSKFTYDTFQKVNSKVTDQTARMCRLVSACVVRKTPKNRFSRVKAQIKHTWVKYEILVLITLSRKEGLG